MNRPPSTFGRQRSTRVAYLNLLLALVVVPDRAFGTDDIVHPRARPGFVVELVAAEPLVVDPVAFDWGPDGKFWVVEMRDYPLGLDNAGAPGGRVRLLKDTDGDGRYDQSTVFLDGLTFPNGVLSWRRGVLITCAPEIFYAEDTDGDGRADRREVLFSGFGEVNPQHRVNGLRWGLDNWVYCANGDFSPTRRRGFTEAELRQIRGPSSGAAGDVRGLTESGASIQCHRTGMAVDIRNRDFRLRPETGELDPQAGQSQYGRNRDEWGNWFGCNHSTPIWHYVLADHYIRRNPHVAAPSLRATMPRTITFALGRGRNSGSPRRAEGNESTSGCSVMVYRDDLFGTAFSGNWFTCEPVHNLVHRGLLVPTGVTFTTRRADDEERQEFLASTDPMFTPAMARTGPDGALWVADMVRHVLEHPHWLPRGWEETLDVRAGEGKGRIYRVFPEGRRPRQVPRLGELTTAALVATLESPNGWQRDKVQQLLLERRDRSAVAPLTRLVAHGSRPTARLHAMCTLDGLGALTPGLLASALADRHPGVRRHAVRLSEPFLSSDVRLGRRVIELAGDPDLPVRLQVAYTLGAWSSPDAARAIGRYLIDHGAGTSTGEPHGGVDQHLTAAAFSSVSPENVGEIARVVANGFPQKRLPLGLIGPLLSTTLGFESSAATHVLLESLAADVDEIPIEAQFARVALVFDRLAERNVTLGAIRERLDPSPERFLGLVSRLLPVARETVANRRLQAAQRIPAMPLLGRVDDEGTSDVALLAGLVTAREPEAIQAAGVRTLGTLSAPEIANALLSGWSEYSPTRRSQVLSVLLGRETWLPALFASLDEGTILPREIDPAARQKLESYPSESVRARANQALAAAAGELDSDSAREANRLAMFEATLKRTGNATRGGPVFVKTCSACHRLGEVGRDVGPDLAALRDKPTEHFLTAILEPNRAVEAKFIGYTAVLTDGMVLFGVIVEETANAITFVTNAGEQHHVLRSRLQTLFSTGKSIMPEGLERTVSPQELADLVAFLRSGKLPTDNTTHKKHDG